MVPVVGTISARVQPADACRRRRSLHAGRWATNPDQQPTPTTCPTGPVSPAWTKPHEAMIKEILEHWIDLDVDAFMLDYPGGYIGAGSWNLGYSDYTPDVLKHAISNVMHSSSLISPQETNEYGFNVPLETFGISPTLRLSPTPSAVPRKRTSIQPSVLVVVWAPVRRHATIPVARTVPCQHLGVLIRIDEQRRRGDSVQQQVAAVSLSRSTAVSRTWLPCSTTRDWRGSLPVFQHSNSNARWVPGSGSSWLVCQLCRARNS